MIDENDPGTVGMELKPRRGRGRPRKPDALSNAERQRRWRERRAEEARELAARHALMAGRDSGLGIEKAHSERLTEQLVNVGLETGYWRSRALSLQSERDQLQFRLAELEAELALLRSSSPD
ncbi:hypothetical protein [Frateuria aurantia]|uniref:Uncharacterized protein n=1 Tax=Frateuria aurantia (strain ATCC 33424 / DSM 6220 / KCTC 2777 / LMG 1558 / NBRC 3245 / NCIMB 13370) TaxID=767434 RepID=H8L027_FRAAD|nr:hypothetical protein [Frateuria aurantia]AFC86239.1 hypothetical protein Fraau_1836 [Frateuria aurantia DSM 6220]